MRKIDLPRTKWLAFGEMIAVLKATKLFRELAQLTYRINNKLHVPVCTRIHSVIYNNLPFLVGLYYTLN